MAVEYGGLLAFGWGLVVGETPMSNPFIPAANLHQLGLVSEVYKNLIAIAAEDIVGVDPRGNFAAYFVKQKSFEKTGVDFFKAWVGAYRDWSVMRANIKHPYFQKKAVIEARESDFYRDMKPPRPEIVKYSTLTDEYHDMKMEFEQFTSFDNFNNAVFAAFVAKYGHDTTFGLLQHEAAIDNAERAVSQKIVSMNPILNGVGYKADGKWISLRDQYFLFLKNKAVKQGIDKHPIPDDAWDYYIEKYAKTGKGEFSPAVKKSIYNSPYVKESLEFELVYHKRVALWEKQWPKWLAKNVGKDHEHYEALRKMKPSKKTWTMLGLPPFPEGYLGTRRK